MRHRTPDFREFGHLNRPIPPEGWLGPWAQAGSTPAVGALDSHRGGVIVRGIEKGQGGGGREDSNRVAGFTAASTVAGRCIFAAAARCEKPKNSPGLRPCTPLLHIYLQGKLEGRARNLQHEVAYAILATMQCCECHCLPCSAEFNCFMCLYAVQVYYICAYVVAWSTYVGVSVMARVCMDNPWPVPDRAGPAARAGHGQGSPRGQQARRGPTGQRRSGRAAARAGRNRVRGAAVLVHAALRCFCARKSSAFHAGQMQAGFPKPAAPGLWLIEGAGRAPGGAISSTCFGGLPLGCVSGFCLHIKNSHSRA